MSISLVFALAVFGAIVKAYSIYDRRRATRREQRALRTHVSGQLTDSESWAKHYEL